MAAQNPQTQTGLRRQSLISAFLKKDVSSVSHMCFFCSSAFLIARAPISWGGKEGQLRREVKENLVLENFLLDRRKVVGNLVPLSFPFFLVLHLECIF